MTTDRRDAASPARAGGVAHEKGRTVRTPTLNRQRVTLLQAVKNGQVYRSAGGCDLRMVRRGQNERVDRRLRELREVGWVELAPDGRTYELTPAGVIALLAAA